MTVDICGDDRFELIEEAKRRLLESTNIEDRPEEVAVLDSMLFRFWQMGWLDQLREEEGAGTCRNIAELNRDGVARYFFVCSECGLAVHASLGIRETNYPYSKPDGSTDLRTFNSNGKYEFERCPRCGRKVTE